MVRKENKNKPKTEWRKEGREKAKKGGVKRESRDV